MTPAGSGHNRLRKYLARFGITWQQVASVHGQTGP